jgi:DNA-binding response OmpR family regulator
MKILVVDDDPLILDALAVGLALQWQDAEVVPAADGEAGLEAFYEHTPDVVVLDVNMPRKSGFEVLQAIRRVSDVPVLMLTARGEETAQVRGLELGADDYMTKPFSPRELLLRVRAVLRRGTGHEPDQQLSFGAGRLVINGSTREVTANGAAVTLTPTEWGILTALATTPGRVYSRAELINRARGHEFEGYERSVDSHVKNLRRKVEVDPAQPSVILTVLGGGYRLGLTRDR